MSDTQILLESGTNELEIMEFTILDRHFGINVSKVQEIMRYDKSITPMPNANPYVEGIFKPRDRIHTVVNLAKYLGLEDSEAPEKDILIITYFNKTYTAFHVHSVINIYRISWKDIEKPDTTIYGGDDGMATGIARYDGRLITIIDFEKILADISPSTSIDVKSVEAMGPRDKITKPILIAEDSRLLERLMLDCFHQAGYVNVTCCENGLEAWEKLNDYKKTGKPITDYCCCVITDIEMPEMDGHRLLKLIREDDYLNVLPVVIFSSMISPELKIKGQSLGATDQLSKPEIADLVGTIDKYIL